MDRKCYRHL